MLNIPSPELRNLAVRRETEQASDKHLRIKREVPFMGIALALLL
jgi:hypothetical protein